MGKRKITSTNSLNQQKLAEFCGVTYAIGVLGGRWKLVILYKLEKRTLRFHQLKELIPDISDRMLTLHLQELEKSGLVIRTAYAEVPPRVEYSLSDSARKLAPIWRQLEDWGEQHRAAMQEDVQAN
jgi:DNA-binding HxlR family transcriptional regulator